MIYGIDPGFGRDTKTGKEKRRVGVARVARDTGEVVSLHTMTFSECVDYMSRPCLRAAIDAIVIENPRTKRSWQSGGHVSDVNIGMGLGAMAILASLLEHRHPGKVVRVYPYKTKMSHEEFVAETGWSGGRCSQDARDAGMIAIGYWREYYGNGRK